MGPSPQVEVSSGMSPLQGERSVHLTMEDKMYLSHQPVGPRRKGTLPCPVGGVRERHHQDFHCWDAAGVRPATCRLPRDHLADPCRPSWC